MINRIAYRAVRSFDKVAGTAYAADIRASIEGMNRNDIIYNTGELVFIHLPKTGGTTVSAILKQNEIKCANFNLHRPVSLITPIEAHKYITFLRHPIERVYSYYQMQLRDTSQPYHYLAKKGLISLLENCWQVRNQACRYYSGIIKQEPNRLHYDLAITNLSKFYFVGNFNQFTIDVGFLMRKLGLAVSHIPNLNEHKKIDISDWEVDVIRIFNQLDIMLYEKTVTK